MPRIILDVQDEQKAKLLLTLFNDLAYVDARAEDNEKIWTGHLPVFDNPIHIPGFKMFTREELHER